jgi:hypothetical protein
VIADEQNHNINHFSKFAEGKRLYIIYSTKTQQGRIYSTFMALRLLLCTFGTIVLSQNYYYAPPTGIDFADRFSLILFLQRDLEPRGPKTPLSFCRQKAGTVSASTAMGWG